MSRLVAPPLGPHCDSWIVSRHDGSVIGEFYDKRNVERFDDRTCIAETADEYLARINCVARACGKVRP